MLDLAKQYNKTCNAMIYFGNKVERFIFILPLGLQVLSPFCVMHIFQVFVTKSICNTLLKDKT